MAAFFHSLPKQIHALATSEHWVAKAVLLTLLKSWKFFVAAKSSPTIKDTKKTAATPATVCSPCCHLEKRNGSIRCCTTRLPSSFTPQAADSAHHKIVMQSFYCENVSTKFRCAVFLWLLVLLILSAHIVLIVLICYWMISSKILSLLSICQTF